MTGGQRVAMLISNGYGPDIRVQKEAHTLASAGYRVLILAWDRTRQYPRHEAERAPPVLARALAGWPDDADPELAPVFVTRIQVRAGYQTGRRLLSRLPRAWWCVLNELRRFRPQVIHAHDLDMLPVGFAYARAAGVPLVYDAREYYAGMVRASVGERLGFWLDHLDGWLTRRADAVLTVGERLAAHYRALGGRVWILRNSQPLPDPAEMTTARSTLRALFRVPDDDLLVVYVGNLSRDRVLTPMLEAVKRSENMWFLIGGDGEQLCVVQRAVATCPRIISLGRVRLLDVPRLVASADVVYYGLDGQNENSQFFMPNLAFFAFGVGRPLLTTPVGEIAELVQREGCGLVLAEPTAQTAFEALNVLRVKDYRLRLADNALRLGMADCNWLHDAVVLTSVYSRLGSVDVQGMGKPWRV